MISDKLLILNIIIFFLLFSSCNANHDTENENYHKDSIIKYVYINNTDKICYFIEPIKQPILYIGVPNILKYSEILKDSVSIIMKGAQVRLLSNTNLCEIVPSEKGNKTLVVYKKYKNDSSLVISKEFRVKVLPEAITNLSSLQEIKKETLLSFSELKCYILDLPIEIRCEIESFSIITFVENKEIEIQSNGNKFTQNQRELIKKIKKNNHLIFNNIVCKLPDGNLRSIPDFVLKIK